MLKIRLARQGSIHRPFYRFVVSDSKKRPSSTAIDTLGYYDPTRKPAMIQLDLARAEEWLSKGAVPSGRVLSFIKSARKAGVPQG